MKDGKKLVYSGDSLRRFLHRKGLTYKDAAKELGLDKNTIGKAVRGGNMNINVLLSIANHWNFPITDFFIFVNQEECEETYFISPNKYNNNSANDNLLVSEDSKIYKNIKNLSTEELALKASKQQEISLLQNLIRNYQDRIDLLQQELGRYACLCGLYETWLTYFHEWFLRGRYSFYSSGGRTPRIAFRRLRREKQMGSGRMYERLK